MKFKGNFLSQSLALLPVFMTSLIYGSNATWLMNAAFYLTQTDHVPSANKSQCGYINSIHEIGRLLFSFPSGYLIDRFGRKKMIVALGCLNFISWFSLIFVDQLTPIYVIRFFHGISSALCTCAYTVMIGELSSPEYRGTLLTINQYAFVLSGLVQSAMSVLFSSYLVIVAGTTAICALFFPTVVFLMESPYYLIGRGRHEQARRNVRMLRPALSPPQVDLEYKSLSQSIELDMRRRAKVGFLQFVAAKSVRRSLVCGILINGLHRLGGSPAMTMMLATDVVPENEYVGRSYYPLIMVVSCSLMQGVAAAVVDRLPRRGLYMGATLVAAAALTWCALNYGCGLPQRHRIFRLALIATYLFVIVWNHLLLVPLTDIVTSELFPFTIRGKACGVVFLFRSVFLMLSYWSFAIVEQSFGLYFNFALYAVASLAHVCVIFFMVPETKGKTLADVQFELGTISRDNGASDKVRVETTDGPSATTSAPRSAARSTS